MICDKAMEATATDAIVREFQVRGLVHEKSMAVIPTDILLQISVPKYLMLSSNSVSSFFVSGSQQKSVVQWM